MLNKSNNETTFLMLPFLLISNYLKREQLTKRNQRKEKIRYASSSGAEFLVTGRIWAQLRLQKWFSPLMAIDLQMSKNFSYLFKPFCTWHPVNYPNNKLTAYVKCQCPLTVNRRFKSLNWLTVPVDSWVPYVFLKLVRTEMIPY